MRPKNKKTLLFVGLAIFLFCCFCVAFAAEKCVRPTKPPFQLQVQWPASPLGSPSLNSITNLDIPTFVKYFFEWGISLGGIAVLIALIIAGVQYITSIANPTQTKDARERIYSALIGLVLLLGSWAIFNLINPNLNTLSSIPDITGNIIEGNLVTGVGCDPNNPSADCCQQNWDCCRIPDCDPTQVGPDCASIDDPNCCMNPGCGPENWLCCQKNDTACTNGSAAARAQNTKPLPTGLIPYDDGPQGRGCKWDGECKNWNCKCIKTYKITNNVPDPWYRECAPNPKVCISTMGKADMGCALVILYENSDFNNNLSAGGAFTKPPACNSLAGGVSPRSCAIEWGNNTYSGWQVPGFNVGSYAAYKYAKTKDGKYISRTTGKVIGATPTDEALIPCGANACGCRISLCETINSAASGCADPDQNYDNYAFSSAVGKTTKGVDIKDETRGVAGAINYAKAGTMKWVNYVLSFKWWPF